MQQSQLKTISIALLAIGLLVFLLLGGIPAIYAFIASTRDYSPLFGLFGSPSVGFANFREFTSSPIFPRLLANSFILSVAPSILAVIIAIPAAGAVGGMSAGRRRSATTVALLLPAFIPDIVLAFIAQSILSGQPLSSPTSFRIIIILLSAIKPASICAFVGACAAGLFRDKGKSVMHGACAGVFVGIAVSIVRFLSGNFELINLLYNPLVFSTADTLETYSFRQGMMMLNMSPASAAGVIRTLPQMLAAIVVSFIVLFCVRAGLSSSQTDSYHNEYGTQAGLVPGIIGTLVFAAGLLMPMAFSGSFNDGMLLQAIGNSAITTVLAVILFSIMLFALAAWLCIHINKAWALTLILILAALVSHWVGELLFFRNLGLANTHLAVAFANASNITFILPLAYLARLRSPDTSSFSNLVRAMCPYFIVFLGLFAANTWGNYFPQMLHLFSRNLMGVPMLFRDASFMFGEPTIGLILGVTVPILAIAAITGFVFVMTDRDKKC